MQGLRQDLEFFIDNRSDISAVIEINERARRDLPSQLCELLLKKLNEAYAEKTWEGIPNIIARVDDDKEYLYWADAAFWHDERPEYGTYFALGGISEKTVIDADDPKDGPFLSLYIDLARGPKGKVMLEAVQKSIEPVKLSGVSFRPLPDDKYNLARQPMGDLLNLNMLKTSERETTIEQVLERMREFSEAIAPVLPALPSSAASGRAVARARHRRRGK